MVCKGLLHSGDEVGRVDQSDSDTLRRRTGGLDDLHLGDVTLHSVTQRRGNVVAD